MDEKLLTMADLARRWQVHPTTIRNWLNEGVIQKGNIKGLIQAIKQARGLV